MTNKWQKPVLVLIWRQLAPIYQEYIGNILKEATLQLPTGKWMQSNGKTGRHSEHMGYILADLQFMQRAYPNSEW